MFSLFNTPASHIFVWERYLLIWLKFLKKKIFKQILTYKFFKSEYHKACTAEQFYLQHIVIITLFNSYVCLEENLSETLSWEEFFCLVILFFVFLNVT